VIYLDVEELLYVAGRAVGDVQVRDAGLLHAAAARPRASAFGVDAYPSIHEKAAALLHGLARNHPLVDGNKRLALGALLAFYGLNGFQLTMTNNQAYDLVIAVAVGELHDVGEIARQLEGAVRPRRP
jgi:death-on-curing protein